MCRGICEKIDDCQNTENPQQNTLECCDADHRYVCGCQHDNVHEAVAKQPDQHIGHLPAKCQIHDVDQIGSQKHLTYQPPGFFLRQIDYLLINLINDEIVQFLKWIHLGPVDEEWMKDTKSFIQNTTKRLFYQGLVTDKDARIPDYIHHQLQRSIVHPGTSIACQSEDSRYIEPPCCWMHQILAPMHRF